MKTINIICSILFLLAFPVLLWGQTDSTLQKEVEVIKAYQPSISDAYKIGSNPNIKDTISLTPTFEYKIYSTDIPVEKTINHLPVVQLGNPPREISNLGYVKGGFGNAWTPTLDFYIANTPKRNSDFGMQLHHFSSRPTILLNNGLKSKAPFSENMARIFFKKNYRKAVLDWEINYNREGFTYYGFPDTDSTIYRLNEDSTSALNSKQAFNIAEAKISLKNSNSRAKLDYQIDLGYNYFWNATGQQAHNANYLGTYRRNYRDYDLQLNTKFEYYYQDSLINNIDSSINSHQYYHAQITPQYRLDKKMYQLYVGLNLATIIGADSTLLWNISPDIYFAYHPIEGIMTLFVGANGGFNANGYQQSLQQNRYRNYQTELMPSEKVIGLYGGLKGKISRRLSYLLNVDYSINQNEAFYYLNKTITTRDTLVNNQFAVIYDDINQLKFGGKLHYSSNKLKIDLAGNYYIYDPKALTTIPHLPAFDINANATMQLTKQISATVNAGVIGPREAIYEIMDTNLSTSVEVQNLKTILDLNLGLNYEYTNQLRFFLDAKNVLNQNYEIWQGYNQPRLLIIAGASYTF